MSNKPDRRYNYGPTRPSYVRPRPNPYLRRESATTKFLKKQDKERNKKIEDDLFTIPLEELKNYKGILIKVKYNDRNSSVTGVLKSATKDKIIVYKPIEVSTESIKKVINEGKKQNYTNEDVKKMVANEKQRRYINTVNALDRMTYNKEYREESDDE